MDTLGHLFGSAARVKILRLFLFNPAFVFDTEVIAARTKTPRQALSRELVLLEKAHVLRRRKVTEEKAIKKGRRTIRKRKKIIGFLLDQNFEYVLSLQNLLLNAPLRHDEVVKKLCRAGKVKLIILSGVFMNDFDGRADLLIVGDGLRQKILARAVRSLEAELGKELRYVVFSREEFQYRLSVYDKLVRDILDYPHTKILDRLRLE